MTANPPVGGVPSMDYPEHERTYQRFITLVKASVIGTGLVLLLIAYFTL
ncbi:aa3-type cytochrome c oxidase subunit IV [Beijerinckia mobilis]|nr:aa3-type cytochrome c oxidase subunit IV [Beijerinckia mobilis]